VARAVEENKSDLMHEKKVFVVEYCATLKQRQNGVGNKGELIYERFFL
jgi:hypothetical protein